MGVQQSLRKLKTALIVLGFLSSSALIAQVVIQPIGGGGAQPVDTDEICIDSDSAALLIQNGNFNIAPICNNGGGCINVTGAAISPANSSINVGNSQTFSATASGSHPFHYSWSISSPAAGTISVCGDSPSCTISSADYGNSTGDATVSVSITNCISGSASASTNLHIGSGTIPPSGGLTSSSGSNFCGASSANISVSWSGSAADVVLHQVVNSIDTVVSPTHIQVTSPTSWSVTPVNGATYYAVITNDAGSITTSATSSTTVASAPTISSHPVDQFIGKGQTATFSVSASAAAGSTLTYQWQKNGIDISGATASVLTMTTAQTSDAANYRAKVGVKAGSLDCPSLAVNSNAAVLDVLDISNVTINSSPARPTNVVTIAGNIVGGGSSPGVDLLRKRASEGAFSNIQAATMIGSNYSFSYTVAAQDVGADFKLSAHGVSGQTYITNNRIALDIIPPPNLTVSLTVTPNPVMTGNQVTLEASASGGTPGYVYSFYKTLSGQSEQAIATCQNQVSNQCKFTAANSDNQANFRVGVVDSSSPALTASATAGPLTVTGIVCGSHLPPDLEHPLNLDTNIEAETQFSWNRNTPYPGNCAETYIVRYRTVSDSDLTPPSCLSLTNQSLEYISTVGPITQESINQLELHPGLQLQPSKNYFWCVQVEGTNVTSSVAKFTTRASDNHISTPTLRAEPTTNASTPSGTQNVRLVGGNGEYQARAIFWQIESGVYHLLGIIEHIDKPNNYFITVDVNRFQTGTGERQYVVQIVRDHATLPVTIDLSQGPISIPASYWFDQTLVLSKPVLEKNTDAGNSNEFARYLKIQRPLDSSATDYDIYVRDELDGCKQSASMNCFLGTKPARLLTTISAPFTIHPGTADYGYVWVTDDEELSNDPMNNAQYKGVSYFAVARDTLGNSSLRSNSVSYFDKSAPDIRDTAAQALPLADGRQFKLIVTGIDLGGFFRGENQPDMHARVWVKELGEGEICSIAAAESGQLQENDFDALRAASYSDGVTLNGIEAITVTGLHPEKAFCYRACISGADDSTSSPRRESCYEASAGTTKPDHVAPDFTGLTSAIALSSGTEVQVAWNPATRGFDEVVQYQVYYTKDLDLSGKPDFSNRLITTAAAGATRAIVGGLTPGVTYYFKGSVLDEAHNENIPPVVLSTATMWVGPTIAALRASASPAGYDYQKVLDLDLIHPNAGQPTTRIALDHLWYSVDGGRNYIEIDQRYIFGPDLSNLKAGTSSNSVGKNQFIVDTLAYIQGQKDIVFAVTVKDQNALVSQRATTDGFTINLGNSAGGTGRAGIAGSCGLIELGTEAKESSNANAGAWPLIALFTAFSIGILRVRRNRNHEI